MIRFVLLGDHRVAELIVLVVEFDDGTQQPEQGVALEGMLLRPDYGPCRQGVHPPGLRGGPRPRHCACLRRPVPAAVPGFVFLSAANTAATEATTDGATNLACRRYAQLDGIGS